MGAADTLFQHTKESAQKFEYFLLGVSLALLAYEGKTLVPQKLGFNAYTIGVSALFLLVLSVIAGFRHVESMIATSSLNHDVLTAQIKRSRLAKGEFMYESFTGKELTAEERDRALFELRGVEDRLTKHLDRAIIRSYYWNRIRMYLLIAGFVLLISAKILEPYLK
jgi:hypothetical protein